MNRSSSKDRASRDRWRSDTPLSPKEARFLHMSAWSHQTPYHSFRVLLMNVQVGKQAQYPCVLKSATDAQTLAFTAAWKISHRGQPGPKAFAGVVSYCPSIESCHLALTDRGEVEQDVSSYLFDDAFRSNNQQQRKQVASLENELAFSEQERNA
eukprot:4980950-Amphidinium_carterae.1